MSTPTSILVSYLAVDASGYLIARTDLTPAEAEVHRSNMIVSGFLFRGMVHTSPFRNDVDVFGANLLAASSNLWGADSNFPTAAIEAMQSGKGTVSL